MRTQISLTMRIGARTLALVAFLFAAAATAGSTGARAQGGDLHFSLHGSAQDVSEATAGPRWCQQYAYWVLLEQRRCAGKRSGPPFGSVSTVNGELRLAAGNEFGAPFLWFGTPTRHEPFPAEGDFVLEAEMTVEQLGGKSMDLQVAWWNPASTSGASNPFSAPVMAVSADQSNGLRVSLLGRTMSISNPLARHAYRLEYIDGRYSLYVDGNLIGGPWASAQRPNAFWVGNPLFTWWWAEWSDVRVGKFEVRIPKRVVEVPFDVKPAGCPSPVIRRARGDLPTAIAGTADLDVRTIDVRTVELNGVKAHRHAYEDVGAPAEPYVGKSASDCNASGADGFVDLALKFDNAAIGALLESARPGETVTLKLTGALLDGTPIVGEDVVVIR